MTVLLARLPLVAARASLGFVSVVPLDVAPLAGTAPGPVADQAARRGVMLPGKGLPVLEDGTMVVVEGGASAGRVVLAPPRDDGGRDA